MFPNHYIISKVTNNKNKLWKTVNKQASFQKSQLQSVLVCSSVPCFVIVLYLLLMPWAVIFCFTDTAPLSAFRVLTLTRGLTAWPGAISLTCSKEITYKSILGITFQNDLALVSKNVSVSDAVWWCSWIATIDDLNKEQQMNVCDYWIQQFEVIFFPIACEQALWRRRGGGGVSRESLNGKNSKTPVDDTDIIIKHPFFGYLDVSGKWISVSKKSMQIADWRKWHQ